MQVSTCDFAIFSLVENHEKEVKTIGMKLSDVSEPVNILDLHFHGVLRAFPLGENVADPSASLSAGC